MDVELDNDWKKTVGFPINYDSGQSSEDDFDTKDVVMRNPRSSSRYLLADGGDGSEADLLGTTPPRSRIRDKEKRRNYTDSGVSLQRLIRDKKDVVDNASSPESPVSERLRKRASLKLIRSKERDFKTDLSQQNKADSLPSPNPMPAVPTLFLSQVESCSRFMSLTSRPKCRQQSDKLEEAEAEPWRSDDALPASRVNFHKTFSMLINMGNIDKGCRRTISREEQVWQNELKDLIWLELQAKIAGRTLAQQDAYLCSQRYIVPAVIKNIFEYRFVNDQPCRRLSKTLIESQSSSENLADSHGEGLNAELEDEDLVYGCLTFDCQTCSDAIGRAMREVGTILDSFYNALSLYPSSKAMTIEHPLIATPQFKNRLKAMCLWFNIALNMRLKMVAVRRLLRSMRLKTQRDMKRTSLDSDISRQSSESHRPCQVRFKLSSNKTTPTDSSNSDSSYAKEEDDKPVEEDKLVEEKLAEEKSCAGQVEDEDATKEKQPEGVNEEESAKEDNVKECLRQVEDEVDSGVESFRQTGTGQTTPEIVIDSRYSTADTVTSQESDNTSLGPEHLICFHGLDPFDVGPMDELTQLRLLDKVDVSFYRAHHQEILKTQGVRRCMMFINKMRTHILHKVYLTLEKPDSVQTEPELEEVPVEVFQDAKDEEMKTNVHEEDESRTEELRRYGCWSEECRAMRLPSYRCHFLLLSAICMEATHDYLEFRLEAKPERPSCLTVKQLLHELKEGLDIASELRLNFMQDVRAALAGRAAGPAAPDLLLLMRTFDATVENVLKLYLSYLRTMSEKEAMPRGALQAEWRFTARLARRIKCAHHLAPLTFSTIVCNQLNRLLRTFNEKFHELEEKNDDSPRFSSHHSVYAICRAVQNVFASERDHTLQAAQWARALAARLARAPPPAYLKERQEIFNALMSIRDFIVQQVQFILTRSAPAFQEDARDVPETVLARVRELLLQTCKLGFELHKELYRFASEPFKLIEERSYRRQRPSSLQPSPAAPRAPRRRRPDTVLLHTFNPVLGGIHKELHRFVNEPVTSRPPLAVYRSVPSPQRPQRGKFVRSDSVIDDYEASAFDDRLFDNVNQFGDNQTQASIETLLTGTQTPIEEQVELRAPAERDVSVSCGEKQWAARVARAVIQFAQCWMQFVVERCDTGRGLRPRWASQGLEFLMLACDPCNTKHLSEEEFEELKQLMDGCISHVIGSRPTAPAGINSTPSPRPRHRLQSPFTGNQVSKDNKEVPTPPTPPSEPEPVLCFNGPDANGHSRRVLTAIEQLEEAREARLREAKSVGKVVTATVSSYEPKLRQLTFKWQRGLKIGAGSFGKVYTVVNTESGQLLAMKELSIGANDRRAFQRAANELRVLEGVNHPHLVRYYGCELHREEMLIFMELCVEGSLEALVATSGGLAEQTVRKYTKQLLSAVSELHSRGIAHRDIKSGNIFLTNEGHCLKLGDFGCAVKIRANTTAPNELQGFVGTQAYMAPEVFMKSSGHGRAADIWSVGCVVTEMASGKRPFCEYDSNYQIMFRVGMGERPAVPLTLSEEGRQFCELCLTHEPDQRPRASELRMHTFLMVNSDDDCKCEPAHLITK